MALLSGNQVALIASHGPADRMAVYALRNLTTNDTVDLATDFTAVKVALFMATTTSQKGICTVAGTVVTIPTSSLAGDAGYLMAWGCAA
jgi:hypothetical protein